MLSFSIVIPTRNRADFLKQTLSKIATVTYDLSKLEIVVVDNGSSDETKDVFSDFANNYPEIKCRFLWESKTGPSFARNKGIENAKHPNIVCIDDDVLVDKRLFEKYQRIIKLHPDIALAGGKIKAVSGNNQRLKVLLKRVSGDAWVFSQTTRSEGKPSLLNFPDDLTSANILINRKVVKGRVFNEKLGRQYGGNLVFAEDTELCLRLLVEGKKIIYDPSIVSEHIIGNEKLTYRYVLERFFRAGIEHRILDREFADKGKRFYRFNIKALLANLVKLAKKPDVAKVLNVMRDVLFALGYYLPPAKDS